MAFSYHAPFANASSLLRHREALMDSNGDLCEVVEGYEGSGKSTLSSQLSLWTDDSFQLEDNLMYDYEDIARNYPTLSGRKKAARWFDEGGNIIFNREAMHGENIEMMKIIMQERQINGASIWTAPNIFWTDPYVRMHRATIRYWCYRVGYSPGYALVMWREGSHNNRHPRYPPEKVEPRWRRVFRLQFSDMDPELKEHYLPRKKKGFWDAIKRLQAKEQMKRLKAENKLKKEKLLSEGKTNKGGRPRKDGLEPGSVDYYSDGRSSRKEKPVASNPKGLEVLRQAPKPRQVASEIPW